MIGVEKIDGTGIIRDVGSQIVSRVLIFIMLILTFWVLKKIFIPFIYDNLIKLVNQSSPSLVKDIEKIIFCVEHFLEFGCLFSSVFIVVIFIIQERFNTFSWIWLSVLSVLVFLILIAKIIKFVRVKIHGKEKE